LSEVELGIIEFDAQSPIVLPPFCLYSCIFSSYGWECKAFLHESFIRCLQPSSF